MDLVLVLIALVPGLLGTLAIVARTLVAVRQIQLEQERLAESSERGRMRLRESLARPELPPVLDGRYRNEPYLEPIQAAGPRGVG